MPEQISSPPQLDVRAFLKNVLYDLKTFDTSTPTDVAHRMPVLLASSLRIPMDGGEPIANKIGTAKRLVTFGSGQHAGLRL